MPATRATAPPVYRLRPRCPSTSASSGCGVHAAAASGAAAGTSLPANAAIACATASPSQRARERERHRLRDQHPRDLQPARAERAQDREVVAPLVERLRERDEQHQGGGGDQQPGERAQQVDADAEDRQQPRGLVGGRGRDEVGRLVDLPRQAGRGERADVAHQHHRHLAGIPPGGVRALALRGRPRARARPPSPPRRDARRARPRRSRPR